MCKAVKVFSIDVQKFQPPGGGWNLAVFNQSTETPMERRMTTTKNTQQTPPGRLLRLAAVEGLTGLRKSTIYAGMANKPPTFPTPVRISARAVAWRESDVLAWIAARTDARPQGVAK